MFQGERRGVIVLTALTHRKQICPAFGPEKTQGDGAHMVSHCLTDGVDGTSVVA